MTHTDCFYLAFTLQIMVNSGLIPSWINNRMLNMIKDHPPAEYPKLYPVSATTMQAHLRLYLGLNMVVILIGLAVMGHAYLTAQKDLLGWDTQSVVLIYFMLQILPFAVLGTRGMKYQQMMRQINVQSKRTATLKPRKLTDFVASGMLVLVIISFVGYTVTVIVVQQSPFTGFAGYWNLLFVALLNGFFWFMLQNQINSKKADPHQSSHDQNEQKRMIAQVLVLGWLAANLFLTTNLWLSWLQMEAWNVVIQSLYFTLVTLFMSRTKTHQPEDYSVYQHASKSPQ